jgi:hypothetical protein
VTPDHRVRVTAIPVRAGFQPTLAIGAAADSIHTRLRVPLSTPTSIEP